MSGASWTIRGDWIISGPAWTVPGARIPRTRHRPDSSRCPLSAYPCPRDGSRSPDLPLPKLGASAAPGAGSRSRGRAVMPGGWREEGPGGARGMPGGCRGPGARRAEQPHRTLPPPLCGAEPRPRRAGPAPRAPPPAPPAPPITFKWHGDHAHAGASHAPVTPPSRGAPPPPPPQTFSELCKLPPRVRSGRGRGETALPCPQTVLWTMPLVSPVPPVSPWSLLCVPCCPVSAHVPYFSPRP